MDSRSSRFRAYLAGKETKPECLGYKPDLVPNRGIQVEKRSPF